MLCCGASLTCAAFPLNCAAIAAYRVVVKRGTDVVATLPLSLGALSGTTDVSACAPARLPALPASDQPPALTLGPSPSPPQPPLQRKFTFLPGAIPPFEKYVVEVTAINGAPANLESDAASTDFIANPPQARAPLLAGCLLACHAVALHIMRVA